MKRIRRLDRSAKNVPVIAMTTDVKSQQVFHPHALDEMKRLLGEERTAAWVNMLRARLEAIVATNISAAPRDKLAENAHSLVSQAGSLGFTKLSRLSGDLEEACLQRTDYSASLSHVKTACREALSRIDRIQNGGSDHLVGTHQT